MDRLVQKIYNSISWKIPFSNEQKIEQTKILDTYMKYDSLHLFIDDMVDTNCECLTKEEMLEKFEDGEFFESNMQELNLDLEDFKQFCIYMDVKVLKYFEKNLEDIIEIIKKRYQ